MDSIPSLPPLTSTDRAVELRTRMGDNLVAIGRDRSETAFEDFYGYYADRVKSFLIGKGMLDQVAEELAQEIMLIVWRRADSYDAKKAAASTWLYTIARNRRTDYLRRKSKIEVEHIDEMLYVQMTETDTTEKFVSDLQTVKQLRRALDNLPRVQRQVVHLSYFRGQSHATIAKWLDLPIGTVKSRIRLAILAVRASLQNEELI